MSVSHPPGSPACSKRRDSVSRSASQPAVVTVAAAGYYLVQMLGMDPALPLDARDYRMAMLVSIGGAIVVTIVLSIVINIVAGMVTGDTDTSADLRDRQISRFGDHVGQSFVIIGAVAALILLMLDVAPFWVAQAIYLGFVLSGILSAVARIASYRFGFSLW